MLLDNHYGLASRPAGHLWSEVTNEQFHALNINQDMAMITVIHVCRHMWA